MTLQRSANVGVTLAILRSVGEHPDPVRSQATLILDWLASEDGERAARGVIVRYRVQLEPQDLLHLAWIRITTSFSARNEPVQSIHGVDDAARYGYRVLSNLALDQLRAERRRVERDDRLPTRGIGTVVGPVVGPEDHVVGTVFFEEVIRRASVLPVESGNCGGCSPDMIRSIAIRVVQSIALEATSSVSGDSPPARGREWLDHIVESAIGRIGGEGGSARVRKRLSRCKSCVREFLVEVLEQMEDRHG
ncbi:MAG: hypothetical protein EB037_05445 [Actinobacteria bacterium]|nr:hypothetical protein [Actinomycetota bacterium]